MSQPRRPHARALAAAALASLSAASLAPAALFSFSSDTSSGTWTFTGSGATFSSATGTTPVTLLIDDNNGPLPTLEFSTRFAANITIAHAGMTPLGGGSFAHSYTAGGTFSFTDVSTNITILSVAFQGQLFTAHGGASSWFSTASLQGDNNVGSTVLTWAGANLPNYDLLVGNHNGGFSFGLATLNSSGAIPYGGQNLGVALSNHLPSTWFSEASFAATTIPAPAALPLLGAAGLLASRRRRA